MATVFEPDGNGGYILPEGIELGTLDPYERGQIWNYMVNAILRIGSSQADGDPSNVACEGAVFYGKNQEGDAMSSVNVGFTRIKHDRFGIYTAKLGGYTGYTFRIDGSSFYFTNVAGTKTFEFDRFLGVLKLAGVVRSKIQQTALGAGVVTLAAASPFVKLTGHVDGNTVATITGGISGYSQKLIIRFVDNKVTISHNAVHTANTVFFKAGVDYGSIADAVLELLFDGTSWYEV